MKLLDVTIRESTYLKNGFDTKNAIHFLREYSKLMRFSEVEALELCFLDNRKDEPFFYNPDFITRARDALDDRYGLISVLHPNAVDLARWDKKVIQLFSSVRIMVNTEMDSNCESIICFLHELGIPVSVNVIYISQKSLQFIDNCIESCRKLGVEVFTIADSSGTCLPRDIKKTIEHIYSVKEMFKMNLHLHNHMGLALTNAFECLNYLDYLDCSINGYGKGGGNLELERIVFLLRRLGASSLTSNEIENYIELSQYLIEDVIGDRYEFYIEKLKNALVGFYDLNLRQVDEIENQTNRDPVNFCIRVVADHSI